MRYEQPQHRGWELATAKKLAEEWDRAFNLLPEFNPYDAEFYDLNDNLWAIAEIRTKPKNRFNDYPIIMIDFTKWLTLVNAESAGVLGLYIVVFLDGIYQCRPAKLNAEEFPKTHEGRHDRPDDHRAVVRVPTKHFARISDSEGIFAKGVTAR